MSRTASIEAATWLTRLKSNARARFDALGIPKPSDENWRQTNVQPVAAFATTLAREATLSAAEIDALPTNSASPCLAVLVNGRYDAALSRTSGLKDGVRVESLAAVLAARPGALEASLGATATVEDRAFVALNTASFTDGVVVTVEAGVDAAVPVHVIHVAVPGEAPCAVHPRTLVIAGPGSRLDIVESFISVGDGVHLTNAVTEVIVGADAHVEHVKVQAEGKGAWHVATVAGHQAAHARFRSHNVSLGASVARNDIASRLAGPGAECHLYGLYVADGTQHVDNHTSLDHAVPNCPSWEMYKGVLAGSARAVFNGRIVVRPDAQKTDAKQSNKNLLLSDRAVVHTRPQLEIYANDVKCTHGATIGRLDETSLFYLRTRGIGRDEARDLLIHAFADDVLDKIPVASVRQSLATGLYDRLARDLAGVDGAA